MISIPGYPAFTNVRPIDRGCSGDRKFYVETQDGTRLLLRISDASEHDRRKTMFDRLARVAALGVPMPQPVAFGTCEDGQSVYQLLTWCEGNNLAEALQSLSAAEQYRLGVASGDILRTIHALPAPDTLEDWYTRYTAQNDARIAGFAQCGTAIPGGEALLRYYDENKGLLRGRPQCFHHGDFHTENLLLSGQHTLSVIDWELLDYDNYGDPWEEFNRINCVDLAPYFTSGQIDGYFGGNPPEAFWPLLALYLTAGTMMLVTWAHFLQRDQLPYATQNAADVLAWFHRGDDCIPIWYAKP